MPEESQASDEDGVEGVDEKVLASAFAGLDFSHLFEGMQVQEELIENALRPLQNIPLDALFEPQLTSLIEAQKMIARQPILEMQQEFQASLQPLIASQLQELQYSLRPVMAASIAPALKELRMASTLPALRAFEQMQLPSAQLAAALDEMKAVDYAVSQFAASASIPAAASETVERTRESVRDLPESEEVEGRSEVSIDWTYYNWLEVCYSVSAYLLDEALEESGVRELTAKQRVGVCLTVAMVMYATTNDYGAFEIATPVALLYAILQDFSEK